MSIDGRDSGVQSVEKEEEVVQRYGSGDEKGTLANDAAATAATDEFSHERWWSEEDDRTVRRKLDYHIVPWLFTTYLFAFLDRSNIGNAKVAGMDKSLDIDDAQYRWLLTIFYISYILFQFLLICYKFIRPSRFMGACVFVWGLAAILQAAAYNWSGLMAARWFVGMAEAGYGTGVALYLSFFYPRHEIGLRFAGFVVGSAVASAIAGSVAYGIQGAQATLGIDSWRLIFIVEAAPTVIVGVMLLFALPDSIATARFLTPHERQVAEARLYRSAIDRRAMLADREARSGNPSISLAGRISHTLRTQFDLRNGSEALLDPISYINAFLLFIVNVSFSAIPVYLPQILTQMGYTNLRAQAFSAPPYAVSFLLAVFLTWMADKTRIRNLYIMLMTVLGIVGYFMLATISDNHTRYGAVWLVVLGLFPSVPLLYSWLLVNANGESKRGVKLVIFGTIGQCGPVLGTRLFPATEAPYYRKGMYINAGLLIAALAIELAATVYFVFLNKRQTRRWNEAKAQHDEKDAASRPLRFESKLDVKSEQAQNELHMRRQDIAEHGDKSIYFRYEL